MPPSTFTKISKTAGWFEQSMEERAAEDPSRCAWCGEHFTENDDKGEIGSTNINLPSFLVHAEPCFQEATQGGKYVMASKTAAGHQKVEWGDIQVGDQLYDAYDQQPDGTWTPFPGTQVGQVVEKTDDMMAVRWNEGIQEYSLANDPHLKDDGWLKVAKSGSFWEGTQDFGSSTHVLLSASATGLYGTPHEVAHGPRDEMEQLAKTKRAEDDAKGLYSVVYYEEKLAKTAAIDSIEVGDRVRDTVDDVEGVVTAVRTGPAAGIGGGAADVKLDSGEEASFHFADLQKVSGLMVTSAEDGFQKNDTVRALLPNGEMDEGMLMEDVPDDYVDKDEYGDPFTVEVQFDDGIYSCPLRLSRR